MKFSRWTWVALLVGLIGCTADEGPRETSSNSEDNSGNGGYGQRSADLIITNGRIVTQNARGAVAQAASIKDGRFVVVGSNEEAIQGKGENTLVIDLAGRTVIPGLNDSHLHAIRGGRFYNAELRWDGVGTLKQGLQMIREQAARTPAGQWVRVVGGWSPYQFAERRMPTPDELNEVAPETPVFVLHLFNRAFVNRAGLQALSIDRNTVAPPGTTLERDANGDPTGVLMATPSEALIGQALGRLPPLSPGDRLNSTLHFLRELNRFGLTSVIDAGGGAQNFPEDYVVSDQLATLGQLPIRISYFLYPQRPGSELADLQRWVAETVPDQNTDSRRPHGYVLEGGGERLVTAADDGANFMEPRFDLNPEVFNEPLRQIISLLVENRYPFRIHATYNESISQILDVIESANKEHPLNGLHWAIDHAETISGSNMDRIRALGGGIAIQARLAYAGEHFQERNPQEATAAPPIREMLRRGIPVGAGTDGTRVASYNPWVSLYWLVTGKTVGGTQLASPENRLSRKEALRLYTIGSAWFSDEENIKGRIAPGQYADFAVLSDDYFNVQEERIKDIESVLTVVGGQVVYGASEFVFLMPELPPISPEWSPVAHYGGYQQAQ